MTLLLSDPTCSTRQAKDVRRLPNTYAALQSAASDFLVLTWHHRTPGAVFYPGCILGAGRQVLFAAARIQERLLGWPDPPSRPRSEHA